MSERTKKIVFLVFFIAFTLGMGYFMYFLLFGQAPTLPEPTPTEEPGQFGQLPGAGDGGPQPPTEEIPTGEQIPGLEPSAEIPSTLPTISAQTTLAYAGIAQSAVPSSDGSGARFYNPENGTFYKTNADGSVSTLGEKKFFNVQDVSWGHSSDQAIMELADGRKISYNFENDRQVTLPNFWSDFDFAKDDSKIVGKSLGLDENNRYLITANPDGTEAKAIANLGTNADKVFPAWAGSGRVVAYSKTGYPQPGGGQQIYLVGQNQENYRALNVLGNGFLPSFSPSGRTAVYSIWHERSLNKPELWTSSVEPSSIGANRRNLKLNTWADKCTWASDTVLYCGVPQDLPDNSGISRDEFSTLPDDLYKVDLEAGISIPIKYTETAPLPLKNLSVTKDGQYLFYTDASTGNLYKFQLP